MNRNACMFWCCVVLLAGIVEADELVSSEKVQPPADKPVSIHLADFSAPQRPKTWGVNFGHWEVEDGRLICRQLKADGHAAASRWRVPFTDAVVDARLRFRGARGFHIGCDPAPGSLDKKGHLYSVVLTPGKVQIKRHRDKSDANSREAVLAEGRLPEVTDDGWLALQIRSEGNRVIVRIEGMEELSAEDPTFGVAKPTVVFRTIGGDVELDEVKVSVLSVNGTKDGNDASAATPTASAGKKSESQ